MPGTFPVEVDEALANQIGPQSSPEDRALFLESFGDQPASWQVKGLFALAMMADQHLAADALQKFRDLPENIIDDAYAEGLEPQILDLLVREHHSHSKLLSKLVLRDELSRQAFYFLVLNGSDTAIDTIRRRNMNLLNSPVVLELLFENHRVRKGTVDRILQVLGMEVEVSAEEEKEKQASTEPVLEVPIQGVQGGAEVFNSDAFRSFLEGQVFDFAAELTDERDSDDPLEEHEREGLFHQVMKMNVARKIQLAIKGNREARTLLLRDSNRLIPLYVLQNKGMTSDEAAIIASNPTAARELIAEISRSREFVKAYKVRRALATNPKTPLSQALRYLGMLNAQDVRGVARSKNVPTALATYAKRLLKRKEDTGSMHG